MVTLIFYHVLTQISYDYLIQQRKFWEVSDPTSSSYGQYLSTHEVGKLIAPSDDRVSRVVAWVRACGVPEDNMELSLHRDMLSVRLTVAQALFMMKASFNVYANAETGQKIVRTESYSIPAPLQNDIDFIGGLVRFPTLRPKANFASSGISVPQQFPLSTIPPSLTKELEKDRQAEAKAKMIRPQAMQQSSQWYPLQSSLVNGDGSILGDFLVRCGDGSPALGSGPTGTPSNTLECPTDNKPLHGNVQMHLVIDKSYNWTVAFENCAQYDPKDTTNIVSMGRARMIQKLSLPSNAFFCAISISNLPNYMPVAVYVKTQWNSLLFPTSGWGESHGMLGQLFTPQSLKKVYGIPNDLKNKASSNSQSVAEFLGEYYSEKDLQRWMAAMDVSNSIPVKVVGPNDQNKPGGEATLDIQWMIGISADVSTWFWSLGDLHDGQEPFLEWLTDISNTPNAPYVHSVSYADDEATLSQDYMTRINTEFQKAGVRGLSIFFASGDDGALGYGYRTVTNITRCLNDNFNPEFPSSSPYITSVGGTTLKPKNGHYNHEIVASTRLWAARITSGGGFSNLWPRPVYQQAVVENYNSNYNTVSQDKYTDGTRGYPDISGMSHNYLCLLDGAYTPIDGTSASTPLVASMFTLINDQLLLQGKPVLGFVNPVLYKTVANEPWVVHDITEGENGCTAYNTCCAATGYPASPGWDASSGLGTVNFPRLYKSLTGVAVPA
jgi:subtilase family serine protease